MKAFAFLIGFHYRNSELPTIPGILVDLYCMAKFCESNNIEYIVLTDYKDNEPMKNVLPAMVDGVVDSTIETWVDELKDNSRHIHISTANELLQSVDEFTPPCPLLIYFTGHGRMGCIVAPSGESVDSDSLLQKIIPHTKYEIMWMMDCCETDKVWGYSLIGNAFRKEEEPKYDRLIVSITPAVREPMGSHSGSTFSRNIISSLRKGNRRWADLGANVQSTFPPGRLILPWLVPEKNIDVCHSWIEIKL